MRIADPNPAFCSSCFQQRFKMIHIDFQVAWDGPVINHEGLRMSIDDLIICQECMLAAASLLGFCHEDNPDLQGRLQETLTTLGRKEKELNYNKGQVKKLQKELDVFKGKEAAFTAMEEALEVVRAS